MGGPCRGYIQPSLTYPLYALLTYMAINLFESFLPKKVYLKVKSNKIRWLTNQIKWFGITLVQNLHTKNHSLKLWEHNLNIFFLNSSFCWTRRFFFASFTCWIVQISSTERIKYTFRYRFVRNLNILRKRKSIHHVSLDFLLYEIGNHPF